VANTKDSKSSSISRIRARLKFPDEDTFVRKYAPNISKSGIYMKTLSPKPVGTTIRFEFLLSDGTPVLKGEGEVAWALAGESTQPGQSHGMGVKFRRLDSKSKQIVQKALAYRLDHSEDFASPGPTASMPPPAPEEETGQPETVKAEVEIPVEAPEEPAASSTEPEPESEQTAEAEPDPEPQTAAEPAPAVHTSTATAGRRKRRRRKPVAALDDVDKLLADISADRATPAGRRRRGARGAKATAAEEAAETALETSHDAAKEVAASYETEPEPEPAPEPEPEPAPEHEPELELDEAPLSGEQELQDTDDEPEIIMEAEPAGFDDDDEEVIAIEPDEESDDEPEIIMEAEPAGFDDDDEEVISIEPDTDAETISDQELIEIEPYMEVTAEARSEAAELFASIDTPAGSAPDSDTPDELDMELPDETESLVPMLDEEIPELSDIAGETLGGQNDGEELVYASEDSEVESLIDSLSTGSRPSIDQSVVDNVMEIDLSDEDIQEESTDIIENIMSEAEKGTIPPQEVEEPLLGRGEVDTAIEDLFNMNDAASEPPASARIADVAEKEQKKEEKPQREPEEEEIPRVSLHEDNKKKGIFSKIFGK